MAVLSFSVASNGRTKTPAGEWQESTEWVRVSLFGQRAETLSAHLGLFGALVVAAAAPRGLRAAA